MVAKLKDKFWSVDCTLSLYRELQILRQKEMLMRFEFQIGDEGSYLFSYNNGLRHQSLVEDS